MICEQVTLTGTGSQEFTFVEPSCPNSSWHDVFIGKFYFYNKPCELTDTYLKNIKRNIAIMGGFITQTERHCITVQMPIWSMGIDVPIAEHAWYKLICKYLNLNKSNCVMAFGFRQNNKNKNVDEPEWFLSTAISESKSIDQHMTIACRSIINTRHEFKNFFKPTVVDSDLLTIRIVKAGFHVMVKSPFLFKIIKDYILPYSVASDMFLALVRIGYIAKEAESLVNSACGIVVKIDSHSYKKELMYDTIDSLHNLDTVLPTIENNLLKLL